MIVSIYTGMHYLMTEMHPVSPIIRCIQLSEQWQPGSAHNALQGWEGRRKGHEAWVSPLSWKVWKEGRKLGEFS